IQKRGDLAQMLHALREHLPTPRQPKSPIGMFEKNRATYFEQKVNDFKFQGYDQSSDLLSVYMRGRLFDVPIVKLPKGKGEIMRIKANLAGLDDVVRWASDKNGSIRMPIHPQELESKAKPVQTIAVRNASSERTVRANVPGTPNVLLKLPLNKTEL